MSMKALWLNLDWTNGFMEAQGQPRLSSFGGWEKEALQIQSRLLDILADIGHQEQFGYHGEAGLWVPLAHGHENEDIWLDERVISAMSCGFALLYVDIKRQRFIAGVMHVLWTAVRCQPLLPDWRLGSGVVQTRGRLLGIQVDLPGPPLPPPAVWLN